MRSIMAAADSEFNPLNLTPLSKPNENYHRPTELKAFDDTKAGVKGLVDAGITEIPRIFYRPPEEDDDSDEVSGETQVRIIPLIDLEGVGEDSVKRKEVVEQIREASEELGFFQLINHGIPARVLEEIRDSVRRFHEQDTELKKQYYTRDMTKPLIYNSNFDLYSAAFTNWRDSFGYISAPNPPNPQDFPEICRDILMDYSKRVMEIGKLVFELLSEALGLNPNYLNHIGCSDGLSFVNHYYPPCPQPKLTIGITEHTDTDFITILLQDHIGGLQIRHRKKWIDVHPVSGALVVNIGDLMQCSYLIASLGLQITWSFLLAFIDAYALVRNKSLHNSILVSLFVVGDWITATLTLAAASASSGIAILYFNDLKSCSFIGECSKYQLSVALAFLCWICIATSSLIMAWLLTST